MVLDQVGRGGRRRVIGGKRQPGDIGRVAEAAIGDYSGDAALPQSRHQDAAGRCGGGIAPAVDHEDMPGRALLDALALRVAAVGEHAEMVEVLARRNIAHRIGRPDHARGVRIDRPHALHEGVAEATLEQNRRQRCGRCRRQFAPGRLRKWQSRLLVPHRRLERSDLVNAA